MGAVEEAHKGVLATTKRRTAGLIASWGMGVANSLGVLLRLGDQVHIRKGSVTT